jgi:hypothetical protein
VNDGVLSITASAAPDDLTVTPTEMLQERRTWLRSKYNGKPPASVIAALKLIEIELGWRGHRGT